MWTMFHKKFGESSLTSIRETTTCTAIWLISSKTLAIQGFLFYLFFAQANFSESSVTLAALNNENSKTPFGSSILNCFSFRYHIQLWIHKDSFQNSYKVWNACEASSCKYTASNFAIIKPYLSFLPTSSGFRFLTISLAFPCAKFTGSRTFSSLMLINNSHIAISFFQLM